MNTTAPSTTQTPHDTTPSDPTTSAPGVPDVPEAPHEDGHSPEHKGAAEAKKYRQRAQAAEAERDTLRQQLTELRRQVAEDASKLPRGGALWAAGSDVDTLFGEDGRLDAEALAAAVANAEAVLGVKPRPGTPRPDPAQGAGSGAPSGLGAGGGEVWGDLLRSRHHDRRRA